MAGFRKCIVLGAGFAGLATARVLSNHFESVVVFDRDPVDRGASPRRCVQQGLHVHLLLATGFRILCQLFPGFEDELGRDGATSSTSDRSSDTGDAAG